MNMVFIRLQDPLPLPELGWKCGKVYNPVRHAFLKVAPTSR